eukprot:TRINITY_DN8565_c0_g1_i2.p2 TRINITY_DN8565_c0_g1~~TRINITY_DN8565_c0_g1_i2.p2  ORF type:complete len:132 (-),score=28.75 TRINITY_DN8565_c0_g1_i2:345-740(-)
MRNVRVMMMVLVVIVVLVWGRCASGAVTTVSGNKLVIGPTRNKCAPDNPRQEPVKPKEELVYCKEYTDFSCCDRELTRDIKRAVHALVDQSCPNCYAMIREYKCAECSPDACTYDQHIQQQQHNTTHTMHT